MSGANPVTVDLDLGDLLCWSVAVKACLDYLNLKHLQEAHAIGKVHLRAAITTPPGPAGIVMTIGQTGNENESTFMLNTNGKLGSSSR